MPNFGTRKPMMSSDMKKTQADKLKGAVKNYGKNVAGGAKIVSSAVKRAASKLFR